MYDSVDHGCGDGLVAEDAAPANGRLDVGVSEACS